VAIATFSTLSAADERPIDLVVPFLPGGSTDTFSRILAQSLSEELKTPIIVSNRPGAGGGIGAAHVAKAEPDGKTILLGTISTHAINPSLYKNLSYDPNKDFTPVARVVALPNLLVVRGDSDIKSVDDLVAAARKRTLTFGSSGSGTTSHLSGELMKQMYPEMKIMHIPYKGSPPAITDLLGGHIDFQFNNISDLVPYVKSGKFRALAVSSLTPFAQLPDVKPMAEQGFPGYEVLSWFGLWLPKSTPAGIVAQFNGALEKVYAKPAFIAKLEEAGITPAYLAGDAFQKFVVDEQQKWKRVIDSSGLNP